MLEEIKRRKKIGTFEDFPIILVANKIDLENQRRVSNEEAQKFAIENGIELIEISAKTRENVDQLFVKLAKKMKIYNNERYFFAGKEIDKIFKLEIETTNCEIPSVNKNLFHLIHFSSIN